MQNLPITPYLPQILQTLHQQDVLVLQADPGAGKSTAVPLYLLENLVNNSGKQSGKILMLEPRRLAAKSIATYLAKQLNEPVGQTVGYQVRNESKVSKHTSLEIITEATRMEVKQFGIIITNIAPGDFATNIAAGRYHTPVFEHSAYKEKYQENLDLMDAHVNSGMNPKEMAKIVFKIINTKNPKIHYKIGGFMEKFSIVLKRILLDKWYEKLLMNHYKL